MSFNIRFRTIFYFATIILSIWFLYLVRNILTPFILGMIFAYLFTPLINYFSRKFRMPRTISIMFVYVILIGSSILLIDLVTRSIFAESESIRKILNEFFSSLKKNIDSAPIWIKPFISDYTEDLASNKILSNSVSSPFPFVSRAFFGLINFFVFLFSAFFFLRDGEKMINRLIYLVPTKYRTHTEKLLQRITNILGSYLRGQLILISSMVVMLLVSFVILGVKNSITISLFSAFFEIVPFIGPIIAAILGIFLIVISGGITNFHMTFYQSVITVALIYYITRQIQDYIISPMVIGKATKLHPLIILFSVLAGERIYGVLGVLLAVPLAASIKVTYIYILEIMNNIDRKSK